MLLPGKPKFRQATELGVTLEWKDIPYGTFQRNKEGVFRCLEGAFWPWPNSESIQRHLEFADRRPAQNGVSTS